MAAQDDKISEKRRRLFKALSAVPVVSTLRPGSALATSSTYQCLSDPPEVTTPVYYQNPLPDRNFCDKNCIAFVDGYFFDNGGLVGACSNSWDTVVGANNIVIIDPTPVGADALKIMTPSFEVTDLSVAGWELSGAGAGQQLTFPKNSQQTCAVAAKPAYFQLKIDPVTDGNGNIVDFVPAGYFPAQGGDALAESCWNSLGNTSTDIFFVRG